MVDNATTTPGQAPDKQREAEQPANPSPTNTPSDSANSASPQTVGAYGKEAATPPETSKKAWDEAEKEYKRRAFYQTARGRLGIRLVSRGIAGAGAFVVGGIAAKNSMSHYDQNAKLINYLPNINPVKWLYKEHVNPYQTIAKVFDSTVGRAISGGTGAVAGKEWGKSAVRFRPTRDGGGRSLGQEIIMVSADFGAASSADAAVRVAIDSVDPAVDKTWVRKDHSIDYRQGLKSLGNAAWRNLFYNQGEDWAVALPYVYFMKGQRSVIDHFRPGFRYDFDKGGNGGATEVGERNGKLEIIGNFNKAGIIDLVSRFTFYNIGTLMYRESYDWLKNKYEGKPATLYGDNDKDKTVLQTIADIPKWTARSTIKGLLYMPGPALLFAAIRAPQHKYQGLMISSEKDAVVSYYRTEVEDTLGARQSVHIAEPNRAYDVKLNDGNVVSMKAYTHKTPVFYAKYNFHGNASIGWKNEESGWIRSAEEMISPHADPRLIINTKDIPYRMTFDKVDKFLNATTGRPGNSFRRWIQGVPGKTASLFLGTEHLFQPQSFQTMKQFSNTYALAAMAYTPYMWSKREAALWVDTGKTDMATEGLIDEALKGNWQGTKRGISEVIHAITNQPFSDQERERKGRLRTNTDTSPADAASIDASPRQIAAGNFTNRIYSQPRIESYKTKNLQLNSEKDKVTPKEFVTYANIPLPAIGNVERYAPKVQARYSDIIAQFNANKLQPPTQSRH